MSTPIKSYVPLDRDEQNVRISAGRTTFKSAPNPRNNTHTSGETFSNSITAPERFLMGQRFTPQSDINIKRSNQMRFDTFQA